MINSLSRGLHALTLLAQAEGAVGVSELAEMLGVDPSSSYRLLTTLERHGYVLQEAQGKKYALGYAALELAGAVLRRLNVATIAGPHLRALVNETGESAHLAVRDGANAVFIGQETATAILRVDTSIGSSEPVHCTAVGKALLSEMDEGELAALFGGRALPRFTDRTVTALDELLPDLARTRSRGYAVDDEELHPGVRCLAAPVRDYQAKIVAAIGISGPTSRLTRERLPGLSTIVRDVAATASSQMGYGQTTLAAG